MAVSRVRVVKMARIRFRVELFSVGVAARSSRPRMLGWLLSVLGLLGWLSWFACAEGVLVKLGIIELSN